MITCGVEFAVRNCHWTRNLDRTLLWVVVSGGVGGGEHDPKEEKKGHTTEWKQTMVRNSKK
jgi:hypothetical protein